jgi:hypothetical protein
MKNFAVVSISGGIVSNIIVGNSEEEVKPFVGDVVEITEQTGPASIGFLWDGEVFSNPAVAIVEEANSNTVSTTAE